MLNGLLERYTLSSWYSNTERKTHMIHDRGRNEQPPGKWGKTHFWFLRKSKSQSYNWWQWIKECSHRNYKPLDTGIITPHAQFFWKIFCHWRIKIVLQGSTARRKWCINDAGLGTNYEMKPLTKQYHCWSTYFPHSNSTTHHHLHYIHSIHLHHSKYPTSSHI